MMEKVLLSIIAASVLCAVSSHVQRQYHFVYEPKNMTEALSYCRDKYTDLATIDNMEDVKILNDMSDLNKMVYANYSHRAWIGLYDDVNSWRWSLSDRHFYKHREAEFRKWFTGRPDNQNSAAHCAQMYNTGQWNDANCTGSFQSVCSDVRGSNVTFVLISTTMTWTEAQSHCRNHYTDLASVRNETENEKVMELIPAGQTVWIGLFRDSWKWSDGSHSSFRNWFPWEPNNIGEEYCVAADFGSSGQWEDWNCAVKKAFVCYKAPASKHVVRVSLKKNSTLNLNDPAVMEDILKQFKQKLKENGVHEDVRLSWKKQSDGKVFQKVEKKTKKRNISKKDDL